MEQTGKQNPAASENMDYYLRVIWYKDKLEPDREGVCTTCRVWEPKEVNIHRGVTRLGRLEF